MQCIKDRDSGGFDICQITNKTVQELYKICQYMPSAEGFNSAGWIKYHVSLDNLQDTPNFALFVLDRPQQEVTDKNGIPNIYCICEPGRFDKFEFMKMQDNDTLHIIFTEETNEELWTKIVESGPAVIMSDEVLLCEQFYEKLDYTTALLSKLDNWDVVNLGFQIAPAIADKKNEFWNDKMPKIKPIDFVLMNSNQMSACLISAQGAKKLLLNKENPQNLNIFMTLPHLVQPSATIEEPAVGQRLIVANNQNYKFFLENLKYNIEHSDIKSFKSWECFGKKGLWIYVPDDHIANSKYEQNLALALSRFDFKDLKDPVPTENTRRNATDPLIVRNAADFARHDFDLTKYDHIVEIGAGYGALANVLLNSGYTGTYTIYDFELMEKVHRHYIQHPFNFVSDPSKLEYKAKTLLISTWGISEMPTELVDTILDNIHVDNLAGIYLIAQNVYESRNNVEYFQGRLGRIPKIYDDRSVIFLQH